MLTETQLTLQSFGGCCV